jgi:hypothetical protein
MGEAEMDRIAGWIAEILSHIGDTSITGRVRGEVEALAARFPLYPRRLAEAEAGVGARIPVAPAHAD